MDNNFCNLIKALLQEPTETEWLEFKKDNADATVIGRDISALANGALICQHNHAYMIWGIEDKSHAIIGTHFSPYNKFQGNQEFTFLAS